MLPVSWVIHLVGEKIQTLDTWNDLDAAVFILTGVAPRAPAGQDNVIPRLIAYIPQFPYPAAGLPALLLRISAGRLILYTAGYLSFKPEALVPTLKFLLSRGDWDFVKKSFRVVSSFYVKFELQILHGTLCTTPVTTDRRTFMLVTLVV